MPVDHNDTIIALRHVSFSYGRQAPVLERINLDVHRGDYLALVGGNGSGKTTLIKIILGLLAPTSGEVQLFGQDQHAFREWKRLGYVPQQATHFDNRFPASVWDVVLMGRLGAHTLFRSLGEEDQARAKRALERVDMYEARNRHIGELSGGEQQRVFLARALTGDPEVLLLDEPTVGVESDIRDAFYALLGKLNRELSMTIILVTHEVEQVAHAAMHIACLDRTIFFHDSVNAYIKDTRRIIHPHA